MKHFLIFFLIIVIWTVLIEPELINVKTINLNSKEIKNLRIVFISDFHLSKFASRRLKRIVDTVNKLNADIIISGGDYLLSHNADLSLDIDEIAQGLLNMRSKYGLYTVLGNHDYYKDGEKLKKVLNSKGIKILENSNRKIDINGKTLYIAGISDMQTTKFDLNKALLNTKPPVILVSHSPDITPFAKDRVNLILSGHTHGGQVRIPFFGAVIVPSKYGKRYEAGYIENILYVTKGLGTSIIRARFNCLPEITVINF